MPFALIYILNIIVIIVLISTSVIKFQIKIKVCGSVLTISHLSLLLTSLTGLLVLSHLWSKFSCVISSLVKIFSCYLIFGQNFFVLSRLWSKFSCVISSLVKIFLCYLILGLSIVILTLSIISLVSKCIAILYRQN